MVDEPPDQTGAPVKHKNKKQGIQK